MSRPQRAFGLTLLVVFGVLLASSGIILHYAWPVRYAKIEMVPIIVGFAVALFAAYWMDPDRAKAATEGVTHAGHEVVDSAVALREGRPKDGTP